VRTVELSEVPESFQAHARRARRETVVLTSKGKPVVALVPVVDQDAESLALQNNPKFLAILRRSQESYEKHGGVTSRDVRRLFGLERKGRTRSAPRTARARKSR
jgi:antitoxin (DNA-binding transcriptional repressor) of toxin-antitoxin stability system